MIEGGSSRNYIETKKMMYASGLPGSPESTAWPLLTEKLVEVLTGFARQQVEAGADVIQVFDSWAGALSVTDYRQFCLPATTELISRIRNMGVPRHLLRRRHRLTPARHARDRSRRPRPSTGASPSTRAGPPSAPAPRSRATSTPSPSSPPRKS